MRISGISLINFKRFTNLSIEGIPETARLVVIVGPNGCGKSSLFDALHHWYRTRAGVGVHHEENYFRRDASQPFDWSGSVSVGLHGGAVPRKGSLYVRTAYRNDPDFTVSGISKPHSPTERQRFNRLIDNDQTVSDNYQRLVYDTTAAVYNSANDAKTVQTLREELIGRVRASMKNVFGDLELNNITDPLGDGAFFFQKGSIASYHYKNLSGGEKAAFDLLLDMHVKGRYFPNSIYCVDELDTHLHTRVQGTLLRELVAILPGSSQLWVTTHSLGVLRAAEAIARDTPGSVSVLDFHGLNLDQSQTLVPATLGRVAWEKLLSVALDDFSKNVAPKRVVVCEGSRQGNRRKDFDAEIYNTIFAPHHNDILFVSGGSASQVAQTSVHVTDVLKTLMPATMVVSLVDRDDRSAAEVATIEQSSGLVLKKRNLECYLFADDVLTALAQSVGQLALAPNAIKTRDAAVAASVARGNPADDWKSAAGDTYVGLKTLLSLTQVGNTSDAFMRDTLAPLVTPGMSTYADLEHDTVTRVAR